MHARYGELVGDEWRHINLAGGDEVGGELEVGQAGFVLRAECAVDVQALAEECIPVKGDALHSGGQPKHGDCAKRLDDFERLIEGWHAAASLYDHVGALAAGEVKHGVGGAVAGDVYGVVDAHAPAGVKAGGDGFNGDDAVGAQSAQHKVVEQAD